MGTKVAFNWQKTLASCALAHFYNEIINHYGISTQDKLGGCKLRQQSHSVANPTKVEHARELKN